MRQPEAQTIAPLLEKHLGIPIRFPAGTCGYGFVSNGRRFIVMEDWREEARVASLEIVGREDWKGLKAVDVNCHRALKTQQDGNLWTIDVPLRPGDGVLVAIEVEKMRRLPLLLTSLTVVWTVLGSMLWAIETPHRGLKIVVAGDAPPEIRQAASGLLAEVARHPLLSILAKDTPRTQLTDSADLAKGAAEARAYDHLVLIGLADDPMIKAAWQREARVDGDSWYLFGFGHLRGDLGYVESDRNPFLHGAAIPKAPYETEVVTLTGSTAKGVTLAVAAFLKQGLINGVVAVPGWQRPRHAILDRDPLVPGFSVPGLAPKQAGSLPQIGVTQASEDEYRGVLEDTGLMPQAIWRWKYYRPGAWDGAGAKFAFDHYAAGLHRRAYGNTLWAAQFASANEAEQAAPKIAAAAKLKQHADAWEGEQPNYGLGNNSSGPLVLWRRDAWLWMSTLLSDATAAVQHGR